MCRIRFNFFTINVIQKRFISVNGIQPFEYNDEMRISAQSGGANLLFGKIFPKNCRKMKEIGPGGGRRASLAHPRYASVTSQSFCKNSYVKDAISYQRDHQTFKFQFLSDFKNNSSSKGK